jgi:hypothetical protein
MIHEKSPKHAEMMYSRYRPGTGTPLRTVQEIFGVYPLIRDAAKRRDLNDLFHEFPFTENRVELPLICSRMRRARRA